MVAPDDAGSGAPRDADLDVTRTDPLALHVQPAASLERYAGGVPSPHDRDQRRPSHRRRPPAGLSRRPGQGRRTRLSEAVPVIVSERALGVGGGQLSPAECPRGDTPHTHTDPRASVRPMGRLPGESGPGDRRAGHHAPADRHVVGDAVAQLHQGGRQPVEEHHPEPGTASTGCWRGRSASRALWRVQQRGPSSATSSARPCGNGPVTRRSATAAAQAELLDTPRPCPVLHEQVVPLTMHQVVRGRPGPAPYAAG
jgi:hypothetical protein